MDTSVLRTRWLLSSLYIPQALSSTRETVMVLSSLMVLLHFPEWQTGEVFLLHPSCVEALKTMKFMLLRKEGVCYGSTSSTSDLETTRMSYQIARA